jgi:hypothetical protein
MPARAWIGNIILLVASLAVALASAEAAARLLGYRPFTPFDDNTGVLQEWNEPDPELGWIYRANSFTSATGKMKVWPDATRRTRGDEHSDAPVHAVLIGCSYAQSFGLDDEASLGWLLQERFPQFDFRNRATGGYGSYQSLLALQRHFAEAKKPTALVIYGLASFHGYRDRVARRWMPSLRTHGHLSALIPPHVDIDKHGELIEYPAQSIAPWRLAETSALANLAQKAFTVRILAAKDDEEKEFRTQFAVIRRMRDFADSHGAQFLAAMIFTPGWSFTTQAFSELQRLGIDYVDCSPDDITREHPDAYWTRRHTACIAPAVAGLMK